MIVPDLNLLVYATNLDAPLHEAARRWWEDCLRGDEAVGLAWVVLLGFVRLTTRQGILPSPLTFEQAAGLVDEWLDQPPTVIIHPGDQHWRIIKELLVPLGSAANLTSDAHLAAMAIEQRATLHSADGDFGRFPGLRYVNPVARPA